MDWAIQSSIDLRDTLFHPAYVSGAPSSPTAALTQAAKSTVTGVKYEELERALFGKDQPLFVGGEALIGCRIIEGPFLETVSDVNVVSFIADVATSVTPSATREQRSVRLNGTEVYTLADGVFQDGVGEVFEGMSINTLPGTEAQTPFASSISRYGDRAVAYRSHNLVEVVRCPLAPFNNIIPFASSFLHEADNLARTDALEAIARYCRFDDSEFDIEVSGTDRFWMIGQNTDFFQMLANFRRIFRRWNIVPSDKLRIFETDLDTVAATLTRDIIEAGSYKGMIADPNSIPRQRGFSYVDVNRDNDMNTVYARMERFPAPLTASRNPETIELPIGMSEDQALDLVNESLLIDDIARKKIEVKGMLALLGSDAGDVMPFSDDPSIAFSGPVTEVVRTHDFSVDLKFEAAI